LAVFLEHLLYWRCPASLLNIEKRTLPRLRLRDVGLASKNAVG
jgi:hypothetical protein